MKEYAFIIFATLLFSVQFLFTKKYQMVAGTATEASFFQRMIAPLAFVIILLCYNNFQLHITPFSLTIALMNGLVSVTITFFSLRALAMGSVANYSLYLLCGGMVLPVIYGVAIGDSFDIWKILSLIFIIGAIAVKFDGKEKISGKALFCFVMLFVLNGLVGVISSMHQGELFHFEKVSSVELMILNSMVSMIIGAVVFGVLAVKKRKEITIKAYIKGIPWATCDGILNGVANLLLLISLKVVAPSLQYPIVTGGTIFLSAVFGFLIYKEKTNKRVWFAVILAVVGTVLMALGDLCF